MDVPPPDPRLDRQREMLDFARRHLMRRGDEMVVVPSAERPIFLLPAGSSRLSGRVLLAHNRLRDPSTRLRRLAVAAAFGLGLDSLATPNRVSAAPDALAPDESLIAALSDALDEPDLSFAMGLLRFGSFAKPVLQLFRPTGEAVGFAKLGWNGSAAGLVRTEAAALRTIAVVGPRLFRTPELVLETTWNDMPVIVTSPVPSSSRRLPEVEYPVVAPIWEIARLLGPPRTKPVSEHPSVHRLATAGDRIATAAAAVVDAVGAVEVPTGAAHGDLVTWNMATSRNQLWIWDWEHLAGNEPVGIDVVHGLFQQFHLIHRRPLRTALAQAGEVARPHLARLGLDADQQTAVIAMQRLAHIDRLVGAGAADDPTVAGLVRSIVR